MTYRRFTARCSTITCAAFLFGSRPTQGTSAYHNLLWLTTIPTIALVWDRCRWWRTGTIIEHSTFTNNDTAIHIEADGVNDV